MKQVIVNQWFESEGGYGRTPRYSLHPDEDACRSFTSSNEHERLHPEGKTFEAQVDDEVYEELAETGNGIWYSGKVKMDGKEVNLSEKKPD